MAAADLQSDMAHAASGAPGGLYGDQAVVGAVARLQDTEQKVESLMREVALLKVSGQSWFVDGLLRNGLTQMCTGLGDNDWHHSGG